MELPIVKNFNKMLRRKRFFTAQFGGRQCIGLTVEIFNNVIRKTDGRIICQQCGDIFF